MLERLFTAHPREVGETYLEHQRMAWRFSARLLGAGVACFIHGLVPGLFKTTGSRAVSALHEQMVIARRRQSAQQPEQYALMRDAN